MGRKLDLATVVGAYVTQARLTADWLDGQDLSGPSPMPEWTRAELVNHICRSGSHLVTTVPKISEESPITISQYVAAYANAAPEIAQRSKGSSVGDLHAVADDVEQAFRDCPDHVVPAPRGPIKLSDFVATRVLEVVVHTLDLDPKGPMDPQALGITAKLLADVLAERQPGRAVELRIPPYVALQLIAGTTHRRGTPPAVVETDALTWVLLATGRLPWSEATLSASGERSDLAEFLPVLV